MFLVQGSAKSAISNPIFGVSLKTFLDKVHLGRDWSEWVDIDMAPTEVEAWEIVRKAKREVLRYVLLGIFTRFRVVPLDDDEVQEKVDAGVGVHETA